MLLAALESGRLELIQIHNFMIHQHLYVVKRKGERLSTVTRVFRDFVIIESVTRRL